MGVQSAGQMFQISLKKFISKKDISLIINDIIKALESPITIQDADDRILLGVGTENPSSKYPVELQGEVIGWVIGDKKASSVASLLTFLGNKEFEKKMLVRETLDKYKEITLLYSIAEEISACLDLKKIAKLVINEAKRFIEASSASVMLLNEETGRLEIIAASGKEYDPKTILRQGEGIAGSVLATGRSEIVNDAVSDMRYVEGSNRVCSLLCAPLKTKERAIGVINMSMDNPINYNSVDLKLLTTLASQIASAIENAILHEKEIKEERIKINLERYIAPQVVKAIIEDSRDIPLLPEKRNIAVLFSDIRNFSSRCEELLPEKMVEYLNEYFTHMVDIIFSQDGTLNKFVGDMIVAFFGAPSELANHEMLAVKTAIKMQKCIKTLPDPWIRDNFKTGIGISSGDVVVGNIGSPQHMDYTAIGDEVNLAERLQSIAQGGQILVSRSVYAATKEIFDFNGFGYINVKGKKKGVEVFKVMY